MDEALTILELFKDRALELLPKIALAALIFLVGWLLGILVRSLARATVQRTTAFAKKRFTAMPGPLSRLPWALFGIVPNILYALVFILTLAVVAETLELPLLTNWLGQILNFLPQAIAAALLVVAGFVGGGWLRALAEDGMASSRLPRTKVVGISIHAMTAVVSVVVGADLLGIDLSFLTTTFYIVLSALALTGGLAFALGCRPMVANIVACYSLSPEYQPGARVRLGKSEGRIVRIGGGYVHVETADGLAALPGARFAEDASILLKEGQTKP